MPQNRMGRLVEVLPDLTDDDGPPARHQRSAGAVNPLSALVRDRVDELGESVRQVASRGAPLVSYTHVWKLYQGDYEGGGVSPRVIKGLALALRVPAEQVADAVRAAQERARAGRPMPLPVEFNELNEQMREVGLSYLRYLLALQRAGLPLASPPEWQRDTGNGDLD